MRLITLSDHAGDMLAAERRRREQADQQAADRYQRQLAGHRDWVAEAGRERDRARAQRRPLAWLHWWLEARKRQRAPRPRPPERRTASAEEARWQAGVDGEREVAEALDGALGGDWTVVKGYARRRGDIDYLVLGPAGLFAVEVKNVSGTLLITRDQWKRVKTDKYGCRHDEGVVVDGGQRPPHAQVRELAGELERFLASRGHRVRLRPVVVALSAGVRIIEDPGVPILTSAGQLASMVLAGGESFSAVQVGQVARLARKDHEFHRGRREG